jgi:TldD protein
MTTRRDFLATTSGALGALAVGPSLLRAGAPVPRTDDLPVMDGPTRELLLHALDSAKVAGAQWADARIGRVKSQSVNTREQQVTGVQDSETLGCGVRVLLAGCWGFAATEVLSKDGVAQAAREATAIARASAVARDRRVELAPAPAVSDGRWKSAYTIDPWTIPIEQKVDLLFKANAAAMETRQVRFASSGLSFLREERNYANTDGTITVQDVVRHWLTFTATAVGADRGDFATRGPIVTPPLGRGWEAVAALNVVDKARVWGEEAAQMLGARQAEPGRYDLILHPAQLFLTIHETLGHSTELDRIYGYEANYAGTSFLAPPEKILGQLRLGPETMQLVGDRSQEGALSTIGWDDDGVAPDDFHIVKDGVVVDFQTTREQAHWLTWWYARRGTPVRSHGCCFAQSWADVQFQRMPNVSLLPGAQDLTIDDLIAATDRGLVFEGRASYSIDQQRYNGQFGAQVVKEVKGGKVTGYIKNAAYQMRTPDFWNAMDLLGGRRSYELWGTFADGKGQPGQSNAVSHGCPPVRIRNQTVINVGGQA